MSVTVGGSTPQLTFADATVQNTAALPLTGGSVSADITVHGLTVGQGGGSVSTNTAVGASALSSNSAGTRNTAIGSTAASGVTGSRIVAIGDNVLATSTSGNDNVAIGDYTMRAYTGSSSTAVGAQAMANGSANTGDNNTAIGQGSLNSNASGASNTAVGASALTSNTTASNNTAVGYQAGYTNSTGNSSTFIGFQAGYTSNNSATYSGNTCIGYRAGYSLTTGVNNTFVGGLDSTNNYASGSLITTGSKNTIIGNYSGNQGGLDIRTASNYIVLSDGDGNPAAVRGAYPNGSGWNSASGAWTLGNGGSSSTFDGYLFLWGSTASGYGSAVQGRSTSAGTTSVNWTLGDYSGVVSGTSKFFAVANTSGGVYLNGASATSWSAVSDSRLKENLTPIDDALAKVASLSAVVGNYTWDENKTKKPFLIAQEVQAVLPEAVTMAQAIKGDSTEYLSLSYTEVIPLLVAAIKEQQAIITSQAADIAALKAKVGI